MRPSQLRVFDNLRITTEHIEHLQGALHSAVRDLRDLAGAGRAARGLTVTAGSSGRDITIAPGLAFDNALHRLPLDAPQTLSVTFAPDQTAQTVCLNYIQQETGEVEGRATLLWDDCVAEFGPSPFPANDPRVPIARLERDADSFRIIPLPEPIAPPPPVPPVGTEPPPTLNAPATAPDAPTPPPAPLRLVAAQGTLARRSETEGFPEGVSLSLLGGPTVADWQTKLAADSAALAGDALPELGTLLDIPFETPFPVLSATFRLPLALLLKQTGTETDANVSALAEATFALSAVTQHGIEFPGDAGNAPVENALVRLPLPGVPLPVAAQITAQPRTDGVTGFVLHFSLHWAGERTPAALTELQTALTDPGALQEARLHWRLSLLWKALGQTDTP